MEGYHPLDRTLSMHGQHTHRLDMLLRGHNSVLILGMCLSSNNSAGEKALDEWGDQSSSFSAICCTTCQSCYNRGAG